jgi:hypothetical protein
MSNVSQLAAPHLRTVTAVLPQQAPAAGEPPQHPQPSQYAHAPQFTRIPQFAQTGRLAASAGLLRLPEGALIAPWSPGALPEQLVGGETAPMVGYLVLVPAEGAQAPATVTQLPLPAAESAPASGGIQLDLERRTARVDGELLDLTYLEFELLAHLTGHPHRVHTRDHLVTAVWGYGHVGDGRTVDVHVARLRRKLGAEYRGGIVTVRRVGYKYVPPKQG